MIKKMVYIQAHMELLSAVRSQVILVAQPPDKACRCLGKRNFRKQISVQIVLKLI